jgi:predicted RNA binding protein YcfA (HicA-like mRNA interferase family)
LASPSRFSYRFGGGSPCTRCYESGAGIDQPPLREALAEAGWQVLRQRGSHEVWGKPGQNTRIVVAGKDSDSVPVGTLSSIRRASGLEHLR